MYYFLSLYNLISYDANMYSLMINFQGGTSADTAELQKKLETQEQETKKAQDEMDRLLKIVKMSQEEQSNKDKLIKELQE